MNEMETELNRLLHAVVGAPPRPVTVQAVRRKVIMRRLVLGVSATAVLGVVASVGLAVSAGAAGNLHPTSPAHRTGMPRYYFESSFLRPHSVRLQSTVRSVATGAIKAWIRCPGSQPQVSAAAAADNQIFFITCSTTKPAGTRIYRFAVSGSGRVSGLTPVRGGKFPGLRTTNLATTADGSELAIDTAPLAGGRVSNVVVINTRTGAHAVWRSKRLRGGVGFWAYTVSFADNGRELAVFGYTGCVSQPAGHRCKSPGQILLVVNHAAQGGTLANSRVIFKQSQVVTSGGWINEAFISPDGTSAFIGAVDYGMSVYRISASPGSRARLVYRVKDSIYRLVSPDPSGRFLLFSALKQGPPRPGINKFTQVNGWLSHGRLIPLKPTFGLWIEVW